MIIIFGTLIEPMIIFEKITSRDNQRLVNARKVRDARIDDRIFIEGKRIAAEAIRSGIGIEDCFVSTTFVECGENAELLEKIADASTYIAELPDRLIHTIADTGNSQGLILISPRPNATFRNLESSVEVAKTLPIVLFLANINNPSNLGAILRTAEAAGVKGVIVSKHSADVFSPKALRASMGAAFRMPIWSGVSFDEAIVWARKNGMTITATTADSTNEYIKLDWKTPRLVVFGSEAHGLSDEEVGRVDETVRIAMKNEVESLNLAVAAGIILFEAMRQNDIL